MVTVCWRGVFFLRQSLHKGAYGEDGDVLVGGQVQRMAIMADNEISPGVQGVIDRLILGLA
jgi:hypothetical protein